MIWTLWRSIFGPGVVTPARELAARSGALIIARDASQIVGR